VHDQVFKAFQKEKLEQLRRRGLTKKRGLVKGRLKPTAYPNSWKRPINSGKKGANLGGKGFSGEESVKCLFPATCHK